MLKIKNMVEWSSLYFKKRKKMMKIIKFTRKYHIKCKTKELFLTFFIALFAITFFSCQTTIDPGGQHSTPTLSLAASSDTGESDSDGITRDNTPTFEGVAYDNSAVTLLLSNHGNNQVMTSTVTPASSFPYTFSKTYSTLAEGDYSLFASQTNGMSFENDQITIDRSIGIDFWGDNNGVLSTTEYNYSSNDNPLDPFSSGIPHIVGPGHTLTYVIRFSEPLANQTFLFLNGVSGSTVVSLSRDANDKSVYRGDRVIQSGDPEENIISYTARLRFEDLAGNIENSEESIVETLISSNSSNPLSLFTYIDTSQPNSSFSLYADNPTNGSTAESDFTTTDTTPTIGGRTDAGSAVVIAVGSKSLTNQLSIQRSDFKYGSPHFEKNAFWSQALPVLSAGSHPVAITVTDRGGNVSSSTNTIIIQ